MKSLAFILPFFILVAAGCDDDPPTTGNPDLAAAFTVAGQLQAGQPVRFDASASTDPGGGGLTYSWSFGDGGLGGMRQIAHLFGQGGGYLVRLTVRDAAGNTAIATRTVTIEAGAPSTGTASVSGRVTLPDGTPLAGVSVSVAGAAGTATSGADGGVTLAAVPVGVPAVVRLSLAGHLPGIVRLALPSGSTSGYFRAVLLPRRAPVVLPSVQAGGTVSGADGVKVQFPAAAVVDAAGNPVTGSIDVSMTPIDLRTQAAAFPGEFAGVQPDGQKTPIASLGLADVSLTRGGAPVQVAPGRTVTLEIPLYAGSAAVGQTIPLWSLSETVGTWVQEGTGTVVASAGSPTGLALRGEVAHFSPWNGDVPFTPTFVRPRCVQIISAVVTPLAGPCWVKVVNLSASTPVVSSAATITPPPVTTLGVWPGSTVRVDGYAFGNLYGQSSPVTVPAGTIVDVDVVLSVVPLGPVTVVAGGNGLSPLWASSDGATWVARPPPTGWSPGGVEGVASSGALWVAAANPASGAVPLASSPDGLAWTAAASAPFPIGTAVAWNGTSWLASGAVLGSAPGAVSTVVASSPNGTQWTSTATVADYRALTLAWNGSMWVMGGHLADQPNLPVQHVIYTSPDGVAWTPRPSPFTSVAVNVVAWNGTMWLAGGYEGSGVSLARSLDGINWTPGGSPLEYVSALGWNGSLWVAGGHSLPTAAIATSPDGVVWTVRSSPFTFVEGVAWTGTIWVATGGNGGATTSPDGITWTVAPVAFPQGTAVAAKTPVFPPL